jgi:hypothetical protein
LILREEPLVTVPDPRDPPYPVTVPETADYGPDHIVEPRTEPAAADNPGVNMLGHKIEKFPGARTLKNLAPLNRRLNAKGHGRIQPDKFIVTNIIRDKITKGFGHNYRRFNVAFPQILNSKISGLSHGPLLFSAPYRQYLSLPHGLNYKPFRACLSMDIKIV